ncbi:hypothetical protein C6571_19405 (plasmid) [Simplicispira suum]|uniref:Uncharacterized protein n=1 Tax=Simplicispira suum TaxID=2109915 RepID=A0A2S0N610_9BURK|nr:hypothetical protein C6571_19405 [Simplicispira suum]
MPLLQSLRIGAAAKGFAPCAQLMLEQALLATPSVKGLTVEAMAFLQGQQALGGAPLAGRQALGKAAGQGAPSVAIARLLEPTLEGVYRQVQLCRYFFQRTRFALPGFAQRLLFEFRRSSQFLHLFLSFRAGHPLEKGEDNYSDAGGFGVRSNENSGNRSRPSSQVRGPQRRSACHQ